MRWRAVGYGLLTDYVAVLVFVSIGGVLPDVSGFYALVAPARLAPLLAGTVAGAVASRSESHWRPAARVGVSHAVAVVGVVLLPGTLAVVATTPVGPLLSLAVLATGVVVWRRWAGTWRRLVPVAVGIPVGLVVTLSRRFRTAVATLVDGAILLPRVGAFAFLAPTQYGHGWVLLGAWVVLTLLGGALGGVLVIHRDRF